MECIQITEKILNKAVINKPQRFDMAVNFYCCIKKGCEYFLVTYYNPAWNFFYPFYDDINKQPILKKSLSNTYCDLIKETDKTLEIDLNEKLNLAYQRFFEIFECNCKTKQSKIGELYEMKFSKTANLYTIYKLYNFIITETDDIEKMLNPKNLKCNLMPIESLETEKVIPNASWFCSMAIEELKENAIQLNRE